ncbi:helix-turn-helix transcriptional regulator [Virgisporangium aurantiacum]|uniref:Transcriptional regulator n=1 Tax=Virgisporangium aurantiacum TaxID=175570 RepID=A0A8J3Z503_9ACTN|nr:LuxR family transcriptional regulator [Virgisporangium aurantiacum]GIJ57634.1 transcriptional regulator [Virgisporangium aurantiacum]
MLEAVGVSEFEERVYRALLSLADSSAADLADTLREPARKIGPALAHLEELGLVRRVNGRRHAPVSPEAAIGMLINQRRAELDEAHGAAAEFVDAFRLRNLRHHPAHPVEVVSGPDEVRRVSRTMQHNPATSVLSFDKPPYATPPAGYDEVAAERPLLERGVEMRVIYDGAALELPGRLANVTELIRLGEKARTLPTLPLKLYVYDRRLAIVPLSGRHVSEAIAVIHPSALLDALIALFEAYWVQATPIVAVRAHAADGLDPQEATVLAMLGAGLTDQAIARQLGVSLRTARRRITAVMDLVHASTRFQAGMAAAHRGWI